VLRVRFSDAPPHTWQFALSDSLAMDSLDVRTEDHHGFSVDAGSALLFDADQQGSLLRMDFEALWSETVRARPEFTAFSTNGDGFFPAYIAFGADGTPCQLIVDLMQVECTCLAKSDGP
jgi:hypothetical protein